MDLTRNMKKRYASTPGTPAGEILAVKNNREEITPSGSRTNGNDDCCLKSNGQLQSEKVCLKYVGSTLNIGSWNVRTLYQQGKLQNLIQESIEMNLDILGVSEHRWTDSDTVKGDSHHFIYSGSDQHEHGVGILLKTSIAKFVIGTWLVSPRNMLIKLRGQPFNISIIQTYAPTTDYSDYEVEEYYEEIQMMLKHVKSTDVLIVMGDFNAKVGKGKEDDTVGDYGLGERNERGQRLVQFCFENNLMIANTFFQKPARKLYTWKSPGDWKRNQIDYILIRKRFRNCVRTCQTYPGADINSDHNPITSKIKVKLKKVNKKTYVPGIDIIQLNSSPAMQEKYRVTVANKYDTLLVEAQEQFDQSNLIEDINLKWDVFKESINHANKDIPKREKRAKQQWMTTEILDLMSERKAKKNHPDYNIINKKIRQECSKAKDRWINHKCRMIEVYGLNSRSAHEDIRLISGKKRTSMNCNSIKDKNGNVLFETDDIKDRWCEYIGELFHDERPQAPLPSNNDGPPILLCEVENALKKMKDGKAQGEDGITTEMLKVLNEFAVEKLTNLFHDIYDTGHIPDELAKSVYITLPKKSKSIECGDFRTISIMPHVTKLLLKIILERIKPTIETEVGDSQFGFRSGTGTREAIFCLNNATQKYLDKQKEIYACFIDYAKAFDRVHHVEIINCLEKVGVDGKTIRLITNLYWHQKAAIRIQGELSPYTSIKRGVRQGCVLSPYLFNIYTEFIFRETDNLPGIHIGGRNINNLRYADDTVLLTENKKDLQLLAKTVKTYSNKVGLEMNLNKTKIMVMSREPEKTAKIELDDKYLEEVKTFKYLGQTITRNGKNKQEIITRIAMAKTRFGQLKNILTSQQTQLSTRLRVLKCYVHSTLLYGSETWTINKELEKKIESFEMWTFRRMSRTSWTEKKTNEEVCDTLGVQPSLLKEIKTRKLKYFGHVKRHQTIQKDILEGRVDGRRPRGRPPRSWMNDIREWTCLSTEKCNLMARDRSEWRTISSQPHPR